MLSRSGILCSYAALTLTTCNYVTLLKDKHCNIALEDVTETYTTTERQPTVAHPKEFAAPEYGALLSLTAILP
jgi:hypothetical protein